LLNAGVQKPLSGAGQMRGQTASLAKGVAMKNLRRLAKQLEASAHRRLRPMKRGPKIRVASGDAQWSWGFGRLSEMVGSGHAGRRSC
jgi:hypothetical protein